MTRILSPPNSRHVFTGLQFREALGKFTLPTFVESTAPEVRRTELKVVKESAGYRRKYRVPKQQAK